jgi:hypothetical protein
MRDRSADQGTSLFILILFVFAHLAAEFLVGDEGGLAAEVSHEAPIEGIGFRGGDDDGSGVVEEEVVSGIVKVRHGLEVGGSDPLEEVLLFSGEVIGDEVCQGSGICSLMGFGVGVESLEDLWSLVDVVELRGAIFPFEGESGSEGEDHDHDRKVSENESGGGEAFSEESAAGVFDSAPRGMAEEKGGKKKEEA